MQNSKQLLHHGFKDKSEQAKAQVSTSLVTTQMQLLSQHPEVSIPLPFPVAASLPAR